MSTTQVSNNLRIYIVFQRSQLHQAAVEADSDRVMHLTQEIPTTAILLVVSLQKLNNQFEFDEIMDLASENQSLDPPEYVRLN